MEKSLKISSVILLLVGIAGVAMCGVNVVLLLGGPSLGRETAGMILGSLFISAVHGILRILCGVFGIRIKKKVGNTIKAEVMGIFLVVWEVAQLLSGFQIKKLVLLILPVWYLISALGWKKYVYNTENNKNGNI